MLRRMLCSTGQTFPKDSSSANSFLQREAAHFRSHQGGRKRRKKREKSASLTSQVCFHAQWIATCILWAQFSAQWAKVGINSWLQQLKDWPLMLIKCCRLSGLLPSPGHTLHHQANQQSEHLGEFSLQAKCLFKIMLMSIANFILGWKLRFPKGNKNTILCLPWKIHFFCLKYTVWVSFALMDCLWNILTEYRKTFLRALATVGSLWVTCSYSTEQLLIRQCWSTLNKTEMCFESLV